MGSLEWISLNDDPTQSPRSGSFGGAPFGPRLSEDGGGGGGGNMSVSDITDLSEQRDRESFPVVRTGTMFGALAVSLSGSPPVSAWSLYPISRQSVRSFTQIHIKGCFHNAKLILETPQPIPNLYSKSSPN